MRPKFCQSIKCQYQAISVWGKTEAPQGGGGGGRGVAILIQKEIAYSIVYTDDINAETVAITFK